jgi:hypothetical protein
MSIGIDPEMVSRAASGKQNGGAVGPGKAPAALVRDGRKKGNARGRDPVSAAFSSAHRL